MSGVKWTKNQNDAITARCANVLVNAAAGSGKTAVLTARIINRLVPENDEEPIRADRLLVVTFTRAAAAEMRDRIERGLKDKLAQAAADGDMKKRRFVSAQIKQLAAAKIMTIDSFCQTVVKEHFHLLDLDPSYSIVSGPEAKIIWDEAFDKLCDELYASNDSGFYLLVKSFCKNGSEKNLREMVYKLYGFACSLPYPERYIARSAEEYACKGGFENTVWFGKIKSKYDLMLETANSNYKEVLSLLPPDDMWDKARALLTDEAKRVSEIASFEAAGEVSFETLRLPAKADSELKERIKALRGAAKDSVKSIGGLMPGDGDMTERFLTERLYPAAKALAGLTLKFSDALFAHKKQKAVLEFSDIEQLAYRLLAENDAIRKIQQERYDEILIDEYQDTNSLQDELFAMLASGSNLFMVGDMKQSIYRFRSSDPLVFRSKADSYSPDNDAPDRKITLSENFRSRREVLNCVNDIFAAAMSKAVGELEYDDDQRLNCGNDGYTETGFDYTAECVVLENLASEDEDSPERVQAEAEYIASRIAEMKRQGFLVRDRIKVKKDNGEYAEEDGVRPVRNSDFAVLMSSHKAVSGTYREVFARYGIDCWCENEGYFIRPEIKLMMSLLRVIENPEQDIPMVAVLRSAAGGFSDEEIAQIRISERKKSFCGAMFSIYSKYLTAKEKGILTESGAAFGERVARFCEELTEWRDMARYMSADQMVRALYERTGLYAFFGAVDNGEAQANLRLFFDRARQYEGAGFRGLFAFLRYMEKLESNSQDLSGADFANGGDYVQIMTIHKSKGLEMPVVFLAGCGKKFSSESIKGTLLPHKELGFSVDYVSFDENVEITSPVRGVISDEISAELKSEEMRKLYVALTRAKEKLIVTACIDNKNARLDERRAKWAATGLGGLRGTAGDANGFIDWIAPAAIESVNWKYEYVPCAGQKTIGTGETAEEVREIFIPKNAKEILTYDYPYAAERLKSKAAVSDFKGINHTDTLVTKPAFMSDGDGSGTEFGTAIHRIMETLPREQGKNTEYIKRHINALVECGDIRPELLRTINAAKVAGFYSSAIGERIIAAKEVYRESEFEIGADAGELYSAPELSGEIALLQGVIDCWFEEDGEVVLVDYKTDRVKEIDEIHQKYDIQLALYAQALEKITKKRVKEKFIYLFSRDIVIQC